MSTWRGIFELSASNTWPLSESEPEANGEVSGHGIIDLFSNFSDLWVMVSFFMEKNTIMEVKLC